MADYPSKLPKTRMNRRLERAARRLKKMTLLERLELQVRAKLLTEAELEEIKGRMSSEKLLAR